MASTIRSSGTNSRGALRHTGPAREASSNGSSRHAVIRFDDGFEVDEQSVGDLIENELIPRLLMVHPVPQPRSATTGPALLSAAEIADFAPAPLQLEADELLVRIEQFLARGVSAESIFVDLLAPSARKLGELWDQDQCDFLDVTMGLWRLQEVMREVALRAPPITAACDSPFSALFSPMPGDQHSFGVLMVEEVFSRAGWHSEVLLEPTRPELLQMVSSRHYDLVGLTITCGSPSSAVLELITAVRSLSQYPDIRILIGGHSVNADPDLVRKTGADGAAEDACSALRLGEQLVSESRQLDSLTT